MQAFEVHVTYFSFSLTQIFLWRELHIVLFFHKEINIQEKYVKFFYSFL